jgi:hypothetical protein
MAGFALVWVKINGHIKQNPYVIKTATKGSFKTVWTLDAFTVSGAW